jgi:hypothetical protein
MAAARIYRRKWVLVKLPLAALALLAMAWLWTRFLPLPPDNLTISSGLPEGAYHQHARRYSEIFSENGVGLDVAPSDGSVTNLLRLRGQLVLYAVLPILVLAGLALVWIPRLFSLRVNATLARYYGELNFLERDVDAAVSDQPIRIKQLLEKLDAMELEIATLDIPDRFADRWYTLRQHLTNVRERLLATRAR